jgi:hypothetical protein
MVDSAPLESLDDTESQLDYQSLEPRAVVALLLGLVSALALVAAAWWFVPILAAIVAWAALVRIRRDGRPGRTLALVGLALAAFWGTMGVARVVATQWILVGQARAVSDQFVGYLHEGSPEKALMLTLMADFRHPVDEGLWSFFRSNAEMRGELKKMAALPAVRLILNAGDSAQVRYYGVQGVSVGHDHAHVTLIYTVTFDDPADQKKKTYFFAVRMERKEPKDPELSPWRVDRYEGGFSPAII